MSVVAQEVQQAASVSAPQPRRRGTWRRALAAVIVLLACILVFLWYIGFLGGNVRAVVPGLVYRSAQLTDGLLHAVLQSDHIHTVINLRGGSMHDRWYRSEIEECRQLGVHHVDVPMSAIHQPPPDSLRELLDTFDHAPYPVIFHCQGGADRSGLTGTIYLNVYRHVPLDAAEDRQLTWRYGHFSWSRTGAMNHFFDLYRQTSHGLNLRDWILTRYPAIYAALPASEQTPPSAPPKPVTPAQRVLPPAATKANPRH